jgi:serine O-acetyltransferase
MNELIDSIRERDTANPTYMEVVLAYPGFHAIGFHRAANFLWKRDLRALARFISYFCRMLTGIEIHPGATIGKNLFIDHGTGVVIGETAIIGDNVNIYHGVTLGSKGGRIAKGQRRHPMIGDGTVIGAGAQVLGDITLGKNVRVGANSVVTGDVPDHCTVVGIPARLVQSKAGDEAAAYGMPKHLIDPVAEVIDGLLKDVKELKEKSGVTEKQEAQEYQKNWMGGGI